MQLLIVEIPASILWTARGTINTRSSRMALRAELPKSLIASNFKRYDPNRQGARVPIRFVPEQEPDNDKKKTDKSSTVQFKISATVENTYKVLSTGGTEAFINHIKMHNTILADCMVKEEAAATCSILIANRRQIEILTVADAVANQVGGTEDNCVLG